MQWYKPLIKASSKTMTIVFLIAGLVMIGIGARSVLQTRGFEKTEAVITQIDVEEGVGDDNKYTTWVSYEVDGKKYTEPLDFYQGNYKVGKTISIKYDPADPSRVHEDSLGFLAYLMGVGTLLVIGTLYSLIRNSRKRAELADKQGTDGPLFGTRRCLETEREVYFLTDLGTAKGTCHIEDADRKLLYEAVATDFSLVADSEYDFVDHEHGRSRSFLVSKTVTSTSDAPWVLDSHSTFSLDGRDVWKSLHENGVTIETGLNGLKWNYGLYRDGEQIAYIESANKLVHEEDAEKKGALAKVPFPGFFRIWTDEEDLSAVFLACFAIGRTDMMIYS